jgi:hypothetical protein
MEGYFVDKAATDGLGKKNFANTSPERKLPGFAFDS